jgi:hypothetical protein
MELTDEQLEAIREAARTVEYGSLTVHISATSEHFELEIKKRIRIERNPQGQKETRRGYSWENTGGS